MAESNGIPKDIEQIPTDEIKRLDRIGGGSFGEVFRGEWLSNIVALKVLKNYSKEVLLGEVGVLAKLRHPHILQFLGVWIESNNQVYIVTGFFFFLLKRLFSNVRKIFLNLN